MAYFSLRLFLGQEVVHLILDKIVVVVYIDIVNQIKVKILHLAFFQLMLKNPFKIIFALQQPRRHFCGEKIALPGVLFQCLSDKSLGLPFVIGICSIKVVDAMSHGVVNHLLCLWVIDGSRVF